MKTLFKPLALAAAVAGAMMAPQVMAYEAGDIIVRGGATQVAPDASSSEVLAGGGTIATGSSVDVDNDVQLGLTFTYMYSSRVGFEVLAATPFEHTITAQDGVIDGVKVGDVKHLPPTFSVVYYLTEGSAFQPYVGAGINYTTFFSEGSAIGGDLELDDSFGLALQVGADYQINDNWHVNASVRWIDIETDATVKGTDSFGDVSVTADIDPMVYSVMLGYTF